MVLDKLSDSLKGTLAKIRNSFTVDKTLVAEVVKEIQKALLASDVNVKLVLDLTQKIQKRAVSEDNPHLNKREHLVTIIYEELSAFLGRGEEYALKEGVQNRILLVGLYGQGKTTTAGKLGLYFKTRGKKVAFISTDTYRPAAYEQLKQNGANVEIDVYGNPKQKDACAIYKEFEKQLAKYDVVIIDSAGRDSLNKDLVDEIFALNKVVVPTDTFLVMGADVGQSAQKQAEVFKQELAITGVIITKMDGTGKGGGALSACAIVQAPVRFIGVGEKVADFEKFNAEKFVSQLIGMGDLDTLLEKAKLAMDENQAKDLGEKLISGEFDLNDFYEQLSAMKKMGSMTKMLSYVPGLSSLSIPKDQMEKQEKMVEKWKFMMDSMTKHEKKNPDLIDISRVSRIAKGSGTQTTDVRLMLKQFKQMKKMTSMLKDPSAMPNPETMDQNDMMQMMKKFGGKNMSKMFNRRK